MRARRALALPLIAVLAVAGGLLVAGCGGSDDDSTDAGTTLQSQNAAETSQGEDAMKKDDDDAMKHDDDVMKKDDGAMKHDDDDAMKKDDDDAMKKDDDDAMKREE